MAASDGMTYAPTGRPAPVVRPGEFIIAAAALDHGHIYGQCNGLLEAGATLKWVWDPDAAKVERFLKTYPQAKAARSEAEVLEDREVRLVAAAAIPNARAALGIRALQAGKDYFTDKTPMTTLAQLEAVKAAVRETGRRYMVYYSERLHVECAVYAGELIRTGAIGRVLNVIGTGPHRLGSGRPDWFFSKQQYGGILCDIGSHQAEQFLSYAGAKDARVVASRVANYANPKTPELEDFGDCTMVADNGATSYYRVDWFTPAGLRTWGDGRCVIMGTDGTIELRKYLDLARSARGDHLFLANAQGEQHIDCAGKVGFPFFGQLIRDCLDRSETAMTQEHAFKAAELCLLAQAQAARIG
jgi:predicted dehydrogenase